MHAEGSLSPFVVSVSAQVAHGPSRAAHCPASISTDKVCLCSAICRVIGGVMRSQKLVVGVLLSLAASAIAGCAAVDQYSGRAVSYNLEAEAALEQGLLLNVVRAVHARPMQFTSVQSISGTASASSTTSLTAPVGPHSNLTPKTAVFSGTVSGGPTFTVPVLDT